MDLEIYFGIKYKLQNNGVKYDSNEGAWFSKHRRGVMGLAFGKQFQRSCIFQAKQRFKVGHAPKLYFGKTSGTVKLLYVYLF